LGTESFVILEAGESVSLIQPKGILKSLQNALPEDRQFLECVHIMSLYLNMLSKEQDNISPSPLLLKWIQFGTKLLSLNQHFFAISIQLNPKAGQQDCRHWCSLILLFLLISVYCGKA